MKNFFVWHEYIVNTLIFNYDGGRRIFYGKTIGVMSHHSFPIRKSCLSVTSLGPRSYIIDTESKVKLLSINNQTIFDYKVVQWNWKDSKIKKSIYTSIIIVRPSIASYSHCRVWHGELMHLSLCLKYERTGICLIYVHLTRVFFVIPLRSVRHLRHIYSQ